MNTLAMFEASSLEPTVEAAPSRTIVLERQRWRSSDPDTSEAAARERSTVCDSEVHGHLLDILRLRGPLSHEALGRAYNDLRVKASPPWPRQSASGIRTRVHELVEDGRVEIAGEGKTDAGRRCKTWRATTSSEGTEQ